MLVKFSMSSLFATSSISYGKGGKSCIKVGIRIRPRNAKEIKENDPPMLYNIEPSTIILSDDGREKKFSGYDFVFDECVTQCQLYKKMVAEYIPQLLSGYNCTIFAYGQTGTGKTFTMEGRCDNLDNEGSFKWDSNNYAGITLRAMQHIFTMLSIPMCTRKKITVTYVELYNEEVYDLLGDDISKKLKIFDNTHNLSGVCIKDVKEYIVNNMQDVHKLLQHGISMRQTTTTSMNQRSSRSHAVFTAILEWDETIGQEIITRKGKINLVDLAGSENIGKSGATKESAREAGNINVSLLALGQVINALTKGNCHIPYRSSKLTRILKDSLGGSALTCLIAAVSPTMSNKIETISTLEYGLKAMNVENDVRANVKARRDKFFPTYSILNDYLQAISKYLRDTVHIKNRNKLMSFVNKDLFSKIDNLILNKEDIFKEIDIWYAANADALCNFQGQLSSQKKILGKCEFAIFNMKNKLKLLEDEVQEKLNKLENFRNKSIELIKTFNTYQTELSNKTSRVKEKSFRIKELLQKRQNFLRQNLKKIQELSTQFEIFKKETKFKMDRELEKAKIECELECKKFIRENDIEVINDTITAEKFLHSTKKEKELISICLNSQDQLMKSFKIKNDKFIKAKTIKIEEIKNLQDLNKKCCCSCEEDINKCNIIDEEVEIVNNYIEKIKSLINYPEKSTAALELKKFIAEIEEIKF